MHTFLASTAEEVLKGSGFMPELERVAQAFYLARTGRPGPVLIDVPKDVQQQLAVPDWDVPMAISGYMQRLPQMPSTGVSHCISRAPASIFQDAALSLAHQPQSSHGWWSGSSSGA